MVLKWIETKQYWGVYTSCFYRKLIESDSFPFLNIQFQEFVRFLEPKWTLGVIKSSCLAKVLLFFAFISLKLSASGLLGSDLEYLGLFWSGRVGKTSLTLKYVYNTFDENQESTTNASFFEKPTLINGTKKTLCIWVPSTHKPLLTLYHCFFFGYKLQRFCCFY